MAEISSLARMYVYVPVTVTDPVTGNLVSPTSDVVEMAFTDPNLDPVSGDWKAAAWHAIGVPAVAKCLIGPGGTIALAKGNYRVWVRITDSPEVPALRAGFLKVT